MLARLQVFLFGEEKACFISFYCLYVLLSCTTYFVNKRSRSNFSATINRYRSCHLRFQTQAFLSTGDFVETIHVTSCFSCCEFFRCQSCFHKFHTCSKKNIGSCRNWYLRDCWCLQWLQESVDFREQRVHSGKSHTCCFVRSKKKHTYLTVKMFSNIFTAVSKEVVFW